MKKQLEEVKEFHERFQVYTQYSPSVNVSANIRDGRINLMREELDEVVEAMENGKLSYIGKELSDLLYALLGTVQAYGLAEKFEDIFDEVHRSNMSKLDKDGKPILRDDGKVLKSDQFRPADIDSILS
jgi:predicted HAD superfamily Cof-like phosphohydrolase